MEQSLGVTHPSTRGSLWTYASLFRPAGFNNVPAFLSQENKLYFFLHALVVFYEQASRNSGLKA